MNVNDIIARQVSSGRGKKKVSAPSSKPAVKMATTTVIAKHNGKRQAPVKSVVRAPAVGKVVSAADVVARQIASGRGSRSNNSSVKYSGPADKIRKQLMAEYSDFLAVLRKQAEEEAAKEAVVETVEPVEEVALTQEIVEEATNAFVEAAPAETAPLANGFDFGSEVNKSVVIKPRTKTKKKRTESTESSEETV